MIPQMKPTLWMILFIILILIFLISMFKLYFFNNKFKFYYNKPMYSNLKKNMMKW